MTISQVDQKKLAPLLDQLTKAIEDLLLTGLTTASDATRQTLTVSFQEASKLGLLRLGGTLRIICEELARYTKGDSDFSRQRFAFFLNRAWLISRGLEIALRDGNDSEFERLSWTPEAIPVPALSVICLGVNKKFVPNAFCSFDFRLRVVESSVKEIPIEQKLVWSTIFPVQPGATLAAEGYLQMPLKQGFRAIDLLQGKMIHFVKSTVAIDRAGSGRIVLVEKSKVLEGDEFSDWQQYIGDWEPLGALERLQSHPPGPLDLDIEMQEEVILKNWTVELPIEDGKNNRHTYPIRYKNVVLRGVIPNGSDGDALDENMHQLLVAKVPPPLFGLLHYERCRLTLQPLTLFPKGEPEYLNISKKKINSADLLRVLKF